MPFLAIFALVAVTEMVLFFWVGSWIGLGWALILALATALIGSILVRRVGLAVWSRARARLRQGELPGRELGDGAAILVAGAFLISPGFITDVVGFLLLVPSVRRAVYRLVSRRLRDRMTVVTGGYRTESAPSRIIDVDDID